MIVNNHQAIIDFLTDKMSGSMKDIAKACQVSVQTIYRFNRGLPIGQKTAKKILSLYCYYAQSKSTDT